MSRKRTGLRNRRRPKGRSTYARRYKRADADRYGSFSNGHRDRAEVIAGRTLSYALNPGAHE